MRDSFNLFRWSAHRITTLVLCSLGILNVNAGESEHVPFVEDGKVWYCGYWHPNETFPSTPEDPIGNGIDCIFTMHGDSLINDREYKKVYCQFEDYYGDREQHYFCAVREEDHRVFIIEEKTTEEKLIYDFSHHGEFVDVVFNDIKFARTKGNRRSGFLTGQLEYSVCKYSGDELDYSNDPGYWIDGVGTPNSNPFAIEFSHLVFDDPKLGKAIDVLSCMKSGKYIFNMEWLDTPVVPTSIEYRPHTEGFQNVSRLYDLQGRRVTGHPTKGVYIQDGKKVLRR